MAKSLTTFEILKFWFKSTITAILLAAGVQILTSFMRNGKGNLPSEEECAKLSEQHATSTFNSFNEFYPFYLCEHGVGITKFFHFIASANALSIFAILLTRKFNRQTTDIIITIPLFDDG